ncbi:MAG: cupin domain-containing protein [Thermomicrobiales bacterium]|nr:cupin domain-containing protein [Thermomicrobiales bacterium]
MNGKRIAGSRWATVLILLLAMGAASIGSCTAAQDGFGTSDEPAARPEVLISASLAELPPTPAFIRLVRMTLQPGSSVPAHTHPGPEFGYVERGVLSVTVGGEAVIAQVLAPGTPQAARVPPADEAFDLRPGDQIVYPSGVPLSFANTTDQPVSILSLVILPTGDDQPPPSSWVGDAPGPDAMKGVSSLILGDALAPGWPNFPAAVQVDVLALEPGQSLPAWFGPVMLSIERGRFGFSLIDGEYQISQGSSGPIANATPGSVNILGPGQAVFFPGGMRAVPRTEDDGALVLLRVGIATASNAPLSSHPTTTATPTAADAPPVSDQPTRESTTAAESGDVRVVTTDGVRLRGAPSTEGAVVAQLSAGDVLQIMGPAEQGDGFTWYPAQLTDDPTVAGYIAEEFLVPAP